jgi:hypothetical protein
MVEEDFSRKNLGLGTGTVPSPIKQVNQIGEREEKGSLL